MSEQRTFDTTPRKLIKWNLYQFDNKSETVCRRNNTMARCALLMPRHTVQCLRRLRRLQSRRVRNYSLQAHFVHFYLYLSATLMLLLHRVAFASIFPKTIL